MYGINLKESPKPRFVCTRGKSCSPKVLKFEKRTRIKLVREEDASRKTHTGCTEFPEAAEKTPLSLHLDRPTTRQRFHRFDVGLPPVPENLQLHVIRDLNNEAN